jgi:transcriptional regulator with XRE-family HTH domain
LTVLSPDSTMRSVGGEVETVGERIRRLRIEQHKRQADIASDRVSVQYVSKVELGQRRPSVRAMRAIAARLGVSADYLETGQEIRPDHARELQLAEAELALRLDGAADRATAILRRVLRDAEAAADRYHAARARIGLGLAAAAAGDHPAAIAELRPALDHPAVTPSTQPDAYATLAHSYTATGRTQHAVRLMQACVDHELARSPVDQAAVVRFAVYLSHALHDGGHLGQARAAADLALEHSRGGDRYTRVRVYWSHARLAASTGDYDLARLSIGRAIRLLTLTDDDLHLGRAHLLAADFAHGDGDIDDLARHLDTAAPLIHDAPAEDQGWMHILRAHQLVQQGDPAGAIDAATEAVAALNENEDPQMRGRSQWALGEALAAAGSTTAARRAYINASDLIPPGSKYADRFTSSWLAAFPADAEHRAA